jgi:hypothetical protein
LREAIQFSIFTFTSTFVYHFPFDTPFVLLLVSNMVLGPTARLWLPYLNFTVAISALGFQTAVLYPWHEELDKEFKILKQEHKEQLHLHQQVTLKQLQDLERRTTAAEKAMPGVSSIPTL